MTFSPDPLLHFLRRQWALIIFNVFWGFLTGIFFALPGLSPFTGVLGLLLACLYASLISFFQRSVMWAALAGVWILFLLQIPGASSLISEFAIAMVVSYNLLGWGELGLRIRMETTPILASLITAVTTMTSLGLGWLVGVLEN
ncbi:MAG: hypothetical protein HC921_19245 [Synechococcaceae cyanobacterium SM2_3_1]|nr:hypothetical protein [Synechococcaceae cyanobacterium SM2_3_1]